MVSPSSRGGVDVWVTGARVPSARTRNSRSLPAGIPPSAGNREDSCSPGVAVANVIAGQAGAEQGLTAGIGCDHAMAGEAGAEPVDRAVGSARQSHRGQSVEIVLIGEQEHRGNAVELRAAGSRRGQQLPPAPVPGQRA